MKTIIALIVALTLSSFAKGQSITPNPSALQDSNNYHFNTGFFDADFLQFHGYSVISGEAYFPDYDFFEKLINNKDMPSVELQSGGYLIWLAIMRNKMFYNISYSFSGGQLKQLDSLSIESRLRQNSLALKIGYNLVKKNSMIISPYVGFRIFIFKHLTRSSNSRILINDYLSQPNIDLRITQLSAIVGINATFHYQKLLSFGFYVEYIQKLHYSPIIRSNGSRLISNLANPVNNFLIGLGMGLGIN